MSKKKWLMAAGIIVVLVLLFNFLNFRFYANLSFYQNSGYTSVAIPSTGLPDIEIADSTKWVKIKLDTLGASKQGIDTLYFDEVTVFVNRKSSLGLGRYIPIVKRISLLGKVSYYYVFNDKDTKFEYRSDISKFNVHGEQNINGFCSVRTAEELAMEKLRDAANSSIESGVNRSIYWVLKSRNEEGNENEQPES